MRLCRRPAAAVGVFSLTGLWIYWLYAYRFTLVSDEGIFIDGARRVLAGQVPYRDFFVVMGPGTFWLQALAFRVFGLTLGASRAVMILDLSIMSACVFWLVSRVHAVYAAWSAAVLTVLQTADGSVALPTHRWDSAAFATLALTVCATQSRRWVIFAAGCCAAFAAWITPPVALVGLVIIVWLWVNDREKIWPFLAGCAAVTLCCAAVLSVQGAFVPMLRQLFWTGANYSAANHRFYGSRGGFDQIFSGAGTFELILDGLFVLGFTLPVILPPLVTLFMWPQRRNAFLQLLFLGGLALIASTYPRMDAEHLTYVAPVFYALMAILAASLPWPKMRLAGFALGTLLATLFTWSELVAHAGEHVVQTNIGTVRASDLDLALIRRLELDVPRGSRLFVFPYLPTAQFLLLGQNPTRYSYLQPGMMSEEDESTAISELAAHPPERVLYFELSEAEILRKWPTTDRTRLHLRRMEAYFSSNYHRSSAIDYGQSSFYILEPNRPSNREREPLSDTALEGKISHR